MKQIDKGIWIKIPSSRLYLEDIEAINDIYKEHFEEYEIITERFELDSIDELLKLGQDKINKITFKSENPHVSLELMPTRAEINAWSDDVKSAGVVAKLKNILDKRLTPLRYLASSWMWLPVYACVLIGVPFLSKWAGSIIYPIFIVLMIFWAFWSFRFKFKNYSLIYLKYKKAAIAFLQGIRIKFF